MSALAILTKCPLANCPLANCPLANCPLTKCPLANCHGFMRGTKCDYFGICDQILYTTRHSGKQKYLLVGDKVNTKKLLGVLKCLNDHTFDSTDCLHSSVKSSLCLSRGQLWNVDKGL